MSSNRSSANAENEVSLYGDNSFSATSTPFVDCRRREHNSSNFPLLMYSICSQSGDKSRLLDLTLVTPPSDRQNTVTSLTNRSSAKQNSNSPRLTPASTGHSIPTWSTTCSSNELSLMDPCTRLAGLLLGRLPPTSLLEERAVSVAGAMQFILDQVEQTEDYSRIRTVANWTECSLFQRDASLQVNERGHEPNVLGLLEDRMAEQDRMYRALLDEKFDSFSRDLERWKEQTTSGITNLNNALIASDQQGYRKGLEQKLDGLSIGIEQLKQRTDCIADMKVALKNLYELQRDNKQAFLEQTVSSFGRDIQSLKKKTSEDFANVTSALQHLSNRHKASESEDRENMKSLTERIDNRFSYVLSKMERNNRAVLDGMEKILVAVSKAPGPMIDAGVQFDSGPKHTGGNALLIKALYEENSKLNSKLKKHGLL